MNKAEIFEHYSRIIDSLIDNSLWFSTYMQAPWCLEEDILGEREDTIPDNIQFRGGATRDCVIDLDCDYVVKFDIDEDANGLACEREMKIYEAARKLGLQDCFCEVEYLGTYTHTYSFYEYNNIDMKMSWYGYHPDSFDEEFARHEDEFGTLRTIEVSFPLYVYRRADHYTTPCFMPDQIARVKTIRSPLYNRHAAIAASFCADFDYETYKRLSDFAIQYAINDIHSFNIGLLDGHIVLIDYSGYHSGDSTTFEREQW